MTSGAESMTSDEGKPDADLLLKYLGHRGPYQMVQISLNMVEIIPYAVAVMSYVFTAYQPDYQCRHLENVTQIEAFLPDDVTNVTVHDVRYQKCSIDVTVNSSGTSSTHSLPCVAGVNFSMPDHTSFVTEWSLVCDQAGLAELTQTGLFAGQIAGRFLSSVLADRYGRKKVYVTSALGSLLTLIAMALAPTYLVFLVCKVAVGFFVAGMTRSSYTLFVELLPLNRRYLASVSGAVLWSAGCLFLAGTAYGMQGVSWRYLSLALSSVFLYSLLLPCLLDESLRWLLATGRIGEAETILKKACTMNRKDWGPLTAMLHKSKVTQTATATNSDQHTDPSTTAWKEGVLKKTDVVDKETNKDVGEREAMKKLANQEMDKDVGERAMKKLANQEMDKDVGEKAMKKLANQEMDKDVGEKAMKKLANQEMDKDVGEKAVKKLANQEMDKDVGEREAMKKLANQEMDKDVGEKVMKKLANQEMDKDVGERAMKKLANQEMDKDVGEKVMKKLANQEMDKAVGEKVMKKLANQEMDKDVGEREVMKKLANQEMDKAVGEKAMKKLANQETNKAEELQDQSTEAKQTTVAVGSDGQGSGAGQSGSPDDGSAGSREQGPQEEVFSAKYTLLDLFRHRVVFVPFLVTTFVWMTNNLYFFALILGSASLSGNRFLNFSLLTLMDAPSSFVAFFLLSRFNRRPLAFTYGMLAGSWLLGSVALVQFGRGDSVPLTLATVSQYVGMFCLAGSYILLFTYHMEQYPTSLRAVGTGMAGTVTEMINMAAPFLLMWARQTSWAPGVLLGSLCCLASFSIWLLPETRHRKLPDTLEEIRAWKRKELPVS